MHPLISDLAALKDAELEHKLSDLTKKYFQTSNPGLQQQISSVIDSYREELATRKRADWEKMMENRDKGLDKLINIS